MKALALRCLLLPLVALLGAALVGAWAQAEPTPSIAMHGKPALPNDFKNFPYANPNAPKGGHLTWGLLGTFDSLNPFIVKGIAVQQIRGYVVESLMARNNDEPFSLYGLLADRIDTDDARSYVAFHINPAARFSDRHPRYRAGCAVLLAVDARPRPSQPPALLFQGEKRSRARHADRPF